MSSCEKCWADAEGDMNRYMELIERPDPCTPEEQAGPAARRCPGCKRMTIHPHGGYCLAGGTENCTQWLEAVLRAAEQGGVDERDDTGR